MLLSLRSNPQTISPYIHESDDLCTRTDHDMLLPIVLYMVVLLCLKMQYLSHMEAVLCSKKRTDNYLWVIN